ncbi:MAG: hypothetical protein Q8R51_00785 [Azonexus sp.]|nr:hypothetical protein [Azonexus sp.]
MKTLQRAGIALGAAIGIALLAFVVIHKYSMIETKYQCAGQLTYEGSVTKDSAHLKVQEHRWGNPDGQIFLETRNSTNTFLQVSKAGDIFQINDVSERAAGYFSQLSRRVSIVTPKISFEGDCTKTPS